MDRQDWTGARWDCTAVVTKVEWLRPHKMLYPDLVVLPHGAGINRGEVGSGFIIQSHFIVLLQRVHDGPQPGRCHNPLLSGAL